MFLKNRAINSDPNQILWLYALGYMPDFLDVDAGTVGWLRRSHRGVSLTNNIVIPSRQLRYVNSKKFELRINTCFEEVVRACADTSRLSIQKRLGKTWLTEELIGGFITLHKTGHAHSFEAWHEGQLAGGVFGLQIGAFFTMPSMFYRVSHASKAAIGRALFHLRDRGIEVVDRGAPPDHDVDYGVQWWPRWKYESEALRLARMPISLFDGQPAPVLPARIRAGLKVVSALRSIRQTFRRSSAQARLDEMKEPARRPATELEPGELQPVGEDAQKSHCPAS